MKKISSSILLFILFIVACQTQSTQQIAPPTVQVLLNQTRYNIVFILVDDMEASMMQFMPKTNSQLDERGASFSNFYVSTSLCCPSRASILRGQYMHNTQITGNKLPQGGFDKFNQLGLENSTIAVWLQQAGYSTALYGKYLNEYPGMQAVTYIPPGWTDWAVPVAGNPYRNFNYTLNENGLLAEYYDAPEDYATDVLSQKAQTFIEKNVATNTPYFLFISVFAPHTPSDAAPRHTNLFLDLELPRPPSFDEADNSDKSESYNELDLLSEKEIEKMEILYQKRAQSVQAVDELVEDVIKKLESLNQMDNTYIVFTSDNGYHMGQHRLIQGKNTHFEEDILVPFLIRGPGIEVNTTVSYLAGNVDIAPTFAEMAGIVPPDFVDGRSLLPLLANDSVSNWRSAYLIERGGEGENTSFYSDFNASFSLNTGILEPVDYVNKANYTWPFASAYAGLRTEQYCYVEYELGDAELYDMTTDPYQLNNLIRTADIGLVNQLHSWLNSLRECKGESCRTAEVKP